MLPATPILHAGLPGPYDRKLFDIKLARLLPPELRRSDEPGYEQALIAGLRQNVQPGDRVVVIGAGIGITAAMAARLAGPDGRVTCYEGDIGAIADIRRTMQRNGVADRVKVEAAIVGAAVLVYGTHWSSRRMSAAQLPDCDLLEMDCEGSEISILRGMAIRPRTIIVETHGFLGAPTTGVSGLLVGLGYEVTDLGWAEPRMLETCIERDVRVLVATRRD